MTDRIDPSGALLPFPDGPVPHSEAGPLSGLRLAVKDLFDVAGYPTGAGNPLVLAASGVKSRTAPAVQRLLEAGAEFIGKAKTDELAYSLLGINRHFGTPINPRWPRLIPGGSSSGSAVAVAAGLADIGLGTDTSGSVRLPATANGVFGWRSSHGLLSLEGCRPLAPSFDTLGILTPSLEGMRAAMLAYGLSESSPIRRLLIPRSLLALCESSIRQALETALEASEIPVTLIDFPSDSELADAASAFTTILQREAWLSNADLFREARDSLDPAIAARLEQGRAVSAEALLKARRIREVITAQCDALMETDASFCLPTLPAYPPRIDATPEDFQAFRSGSIQLLCLAGLGGYPQLSLPISAAGGPAGLSLIGPRCRDFDLIGPANAFARKAGFQNEYQPEQGAES